MPKSIHFSMYHNNVKMYIYSIKSFQCGNNSFPLYGAEVWPHAFSKMWYRNGLLLVQRPGRLQVASAFYTISDPVSLAIAGELSVWGCWGFTAG